MKRIILDKNILQMCNRGKRELKKITGNFQFLLTDVLIHEIYSQDIEKRGIVSGDELVKLNQKILSNIQKAVDDTDNIWINADTALGWEAQKGQSAKYCKTTFKIIKTLSAEDMLTESVICECLSKEKVHGEFIRKKHTPNDPDFEIQLRNLSEKELFGEVSNNAFSKERTKVVKSGAKDVLTDFAKKKDIHIAPVLTPESDWFSYGYVLLALTYELLKFAGKERDLYKEPGKEANAFYDMEYLAYMAIADGIVTNDKMMLKVAWSLWPEKRENLFVLNQEEKVLVRFTPEWETLQRKS
jgi:hypothetical protein